jgi:hypothetical protein
MHVVRVRWVELDALEDARALAAVEPEPQVAVDGSASSLASLAGALVVGGGRGTT